MKFTNILMSKPGGISGVLVAVILECGRVKHLSFEPKRTIGGWTNGRWVGMFSPKVMGFFNLADPQDLALLLRIFGETTPTWELQLNSFFKEVFGRKDSISYSMHRLEKYKSLVGPSLGTVGFITLYATGNCFLGKNCTSDVIFTHDSVGPEIPVPTA